MSFHQSLCKGLAEARALGQRAGGISIATLLLTSCASAPKPPSVDESTRRPVNARAVVDLKACQSDLSRAGIVVAELAHAGTVTTALLNAVQQQTPPAALPVAPVPLAPAGNLVAVVAFGTGSVAWQIEDRDAAALVRHASNAALVMIRGRTDALQDSPQETALARRRAEAAAAFLLQAGVSKDKLRLSWQGAGDPVAGLAAAERGQNRRVEIEFYAWAPVFVSPRSVDAVGRGATAASL